MARNCCLIIVPGYNGAVMVIISFMGSLSSLNIQTEARREKEITQLFLSPMTALELGKNITEHSLEMVDLSLSSLVDFTSLFQIYAENLHFNTKPQFFFQCGSKIS